MTPGARTAVALALGSFVLYNANVREISSQDTIPTRVLPNEVVEHGVSTSIGCSRTGRPTPAPLLDAARRRAPSVQLSRRPGPSGRSRLRGARAPGRRRQLARPEALSKLAASLFAAVSVGLRVPRRPGAGPPAGERRGGGPGDGGVYAVATPTWAIASQGLWGHGRRSSAWPWRSGRSSGRGRGGGRAWPGWRPASWWRAAPRGRWPPSLRPRPPVAGPAHGIAFSAGLWSRSSRTTWRSSGRSRAATPSFIGPTRSTTEWRSPGRQPGWGSRGAGEPEPRALRLLAGSRGGVRRTGSCGPAGAGLAGRPSPWRTAWGPSRSSRCGGAATRSGPACSRRPAGAGPRRGARLAGDPAGASGAVALRRGLHRLGLVEATGAFYYPSPRAADWNITPSDVDVAHERLWDWRDPQLLRLLRNGPASPGFRTTP